MCTKISCLRGTVGWRGGNEYENENENDDEDEN